jgi:hypothetical protein
MDISDWEEINFVFHTYIEDLKNTRLVNQPPYAQQSLMLAVASKNSIINIDNAIDYAGGYGTLSNILKKYYQINFPIYDPYIYLDTQQYLKKSDLNKYEVVFNSAMFEHVLSRKDLDDVNSLVSDEGSLLIHTLVCENIPRDPNWFYLIPPVHTAFHTNKSMSILMNQWGYLSSIYCPEAKSWILLREQSKVYREVCSRINQEFQSDFFILKDGFVDFWKGF